MSNSYKKEIPENPPEEFQKIITDFVNDILNTFPEYKSVINKWWKNTDYSHIKENHERILYEEDEKMKNIDFIFSYCLNMYPERFFDIIYQNEEIFNDNSNVNTEFLPGLSFKYLWKCSDISEKTRSTIWKYLQLILISLISSIKNKETFGDAVKLFENIDENDFKNKLEQSLDKLQDVFNNIKKNDPVDEIEDGPNNILKEMGGIDINKLNIDNLPSPDDVHKHITGMLDGKLGKLASEIAEEVSGSFNLDMENITDTKDIFQSLFKDPGKLMSLMKNVGSKLESKIKSGDIDENELFNEATDIINKMKSIPCMDNIQNMLSQMGLNPDINKFMNNNVDTKSKEEALNRSMKHKKFKENIKRKLEMKQMQKMLEETSKFTNTNYNPISDEELVSIFSNNNTNPSSTNEKSNNKKKTNNKK
jgi:hypothetical protein